VINQIEFDNKDIPLFSNEATSNQSLFSVLIGKNGSGKSRILRTITDHYMDAVMNDKGKPLSKNAKRLENRPDTNQGLSVLAISMSSFDKFSIDDAFLSKGRCYRYLGVRGIPNDNLSVSYLSRIIANLLDVIKEKPERINGIMETLEYLGYKPFLQCELRYSKSMAEFYAICQAIKSKDSNGLLRAEKWLIRNSFEGFRSVKDFIRDLKEIEKEVITLRNDYTRRTIFVNVESDKISSCSATEHTKTNYSRLLKYGIMQLKDVNVKRFKSNSHLCINKASSGEQSIFSSFLSISTYIKDNCVICIDEPENCLHPEWQEKYILNLHAAFGNFKNCHFVIATHSPQIIAKLPEKNCFVIDVADQKIFSSKELRNRSADFQLAEAFKSPGFKNEYLFRELLTALGEISAGKTLDSRRQLHIFDLIKLKVKLSPSDPVFELITLIEKSLGKKK